MRPCIVYRAVVKIVQTPRPSIALFIVLLCFLCISWYFGPIWSVFPIFGYSLPIAHVFKSCYTMPTPC
jgi:hypothetical protein